MTTPVFLHYDQATLDREYDNRGKVADFEHYLQRWRDRSAVVRSERGGWLDRVYGPDPGMTLDIFPAAGPTPGPVQVFFHGGYWKSLSKNEFSFVANAVGSAGAATVVVDYGLIPRVGMAELVAQCRAALAWLWHEGPDYGLDRERLFLCGHSAGGHLVATLLATDWPRFGPDLPVDLVKGGCGISGLYDLEPIRLSYLNVDLKLTPADVDAFSPVRLTLPRPAPLLLPVGELEGPEYRRQAEDLVSAWRRQGAMPELLVMADHHHFSIVDQLDDPLSELSRAIVAQMGLRPAGGE